MPAGGVEGSAVAVGRAGVTRTRYDDAMRAVLLLVVSSMLAVSGCGARSTLTTAADADASFPEDHGTVEADIVLTDLMQDCMPHSQPDRVSVGGTITFTNHRSFAVGPVAVVSAQFLDASSAVIATFGVALTPSTIVVQPGATSTVGFAKTRDSLSPAAFCRPALCGRVRVVVTFGGPGVPPGVVAVSDETSSSCPQ